MVTPEEIENRVFSLVRRGYDPTEVDDFLREVATTVRDLEAGAATPDVLPPLPPPPAPDPQAATSADTLGADAFAQLGEEVAAVLRQAHESVDKLRRNAEGEALLIRQEAQREADALKADADRDRQQAAVDLEAARQEAAQVVSAAQAQSDAIAAQAAERARTRAQEVIEQARVDARDAVTVQRNVRGRLEDTRGHIDQALDRLVEEDQDLFEIDLTDEAVDRGTDGIVVDPPPDAPPPGQGPPSPAIPPPPRAPIDLTNLPYATEDDDDEASGEEPDDEAPGGDRGGQPIPPPPPPPATDPAGATAPVPDQPSTDDGEEDALAQMVKNAVENALKRRKGDTEPPADGGS